MHRGRISSRSAQHKIALGLLAIGLLMRLLIPAGWMPAAGNGYAIMLCTGMGAATAWVDEEGNVHKEKPGPAQTSDHPCTFAGSGSAFTGTDLPDPPIPSVISASFSMGMAFEAVAIGRGLAAPPPPPTGPPAANL